MVHCNAGINRSIGPFPLSKTESAKRSPSPELPVAGQQASKKTLHRNPKGACLAPASRRNIFPATTVALKSTPQLASTSRGAVNTPALNGAKERQRLTVKDSNYRAETGCRINRSDDVVEISAPEPSGSVTEMVLKSFTLPDSLASGS